VAKLSSRYASALFDLSLERNALNDNLEQAEFLRDTFSEAQCQRIIKHPRISGKEKKSFFDSAFSGKISNDLLGFLHLAVEKNREAFIVPVLDDFIDMGNRHIRKTTALVVSAVPLKNEQVSALEALLSKKLDKQVTINHKVDPSLIGGLYVQVDGYYIDRTVKSSLKDIKDSLISGVDVV